MAVAQLGNFDSTDNFYLILLMVLFELGILIIKRSSTFSTRVLSTLVSKLVHSGFYIYRKSFCKNLKSAMNWRFWSLR